MAKGSALDEYLSRLGWQIDPDLNAVIVPQNPDNQIEATVVRESIHLPRELDLISQIRYPTFPRSDRAYKNHRSRANCLTSKKPSLVLAVR